MKNRFIFVALVLLPIFSAFSFETSVPNSVLSGKLDSLTVFDAIIKNTSADTVTISMVRDSLKTPDGWNASFCVGQMCYPDFVDSVDFKVAPNDSVKVTLDVTPNTNKGWGFYTLTLVDKNNVTSYETLSFGLTTETVNNTEILSITKENGFTAYDSLGKMGAFKQVVVNTSADTVELKIVKEAVVLSDNYSFSLCANEQCYPPFVDTLPNVKLAPKDTLVIDLDYTTASVAGSIIEKFSIIDETNNQTSDDIYSVFIRAETGIILAKALDTPKSISLLRKGNEIEISGFNRNETVYFNLYSLNGSLLSANKYTATNGRITENFVPIATGRYILHVKGININFSTGISITR